MEEYSRETLAQKWDEFFAEFGYTQRIKEVADSYPETRSLYVQFGDIDRFDADLATYLFHRPKTMLSAGERQIAQLLPPGAEGAEIWLRIMNLPPDWHVEIRNIRSKHQGRFIAVSGLVKRVTEVRPRIVDAVFECMRCGHQTRVGQEGTLLQEPLECPKGELDDNGVAGCGRAAASTSFKLVYERSVYIDSQKVELQELPEELKGGAQPQSLTVYSEDDLAGQVFPGDRVTLSGILQSKLRGIGRQRTTLFDIFLALNTIAKEEIEYKDVEVTPEDEIQIRGLASDPHLFAKLTRSVSPTIYGLDVEKEALALQLFGGVPKVMPDGTRIRGDIHLLFVGDPGTAKSQLLRYISEMSPRGIYASGKSSTGAGLTATAIKDEFGEGRWTLEAGALVLADRGIAAIDELDKMNDQDRSAMHEAMEQQTISVAKAGITATLQARCALLGAANPKFGRFDIHTPIVDQINLPITLLSRFDLIFPIQDVPEPHRDTMVASHILRAHQVGEMRRQIKEGIPLPDGYDLDSAEVEMQPEIDHVLMRKYISMSRKVVPVLSNEAIEELRNYYLRVRESGGGSADERRGAVSITARQLEAYIRLSEASARARLSSVVTIDDAQRAIRIFGEYMKRVMGLGTEQYDIDIVATGIPSSQRDEIRIILEIIRDLERASGGKGAALDDIIANAKERRILEDRVRSILERLRIQAGEIYERGKYYFIIGA